MTPHHGSHAAYRNHIDRGEPACNECLRDRADYVRSRRIKTRSTYALYVDYAVIRQLLTVPELRSYMTRSIGPRTTQAIEAL